MTDAANSLTIDMEAEPRDIVSAVLHDPRIVIMNPEKRKELYAHIRKEVAETPVDMATKKGRDAIRTLAAKIARTKTTVDKAGMEMNKSARAAIDAMNKIRGELETDLQNLQDTARKPLTDWEDAEKQRQEYVNAEIEGLRVAHTGIDQMQPETLLQYIETLKTRIFDPDQFQEQAEQAELLRNAAVVRLVETHARMVKDIADKAELETLRAEAERRRVEDQEREAEAQRQRDAAAAAEAQEAQRVKDAEAEAERIKAAAATAAAEAQAEEKRKADAAIAEAKRRSDEAIAELERAHQAELKAAQDAREAEDKKRRDAEAAAAESARHEQARKDKEASDADTFARNQQHRNSIMTIVKNDLMNEAAIDEATARRIVLCIAKGKIRKTAIAF